MDVTVLYNLTYGLYVVGAMDGERPVGCVINTCFQVTSQNPIIAISLNKNNHTTEVLKRNPRFSLSIITEETDVVTIGTFGFQSCKNEGVDKYGEFGYTMHEGAPLVNGKFAGRLVCDVLNMVDNETHMVVLARVVDTVKGEGHPMTYEYYHKVVKGSAPKNAPTYREERKQEAAPVKKKWRCDVCGYVVEADALADDFKCPICKMGREHFKEV